MSGADRELAILRTAWLCQAPYEWGEHVLVAKKLGIASEDIERITVGSDAPGWSKHEQAILRATEELPIVIGQYQAVAYYQDSLRLRLNDGNLGLRAR